ncbi:Phospholipase C [Myotisia sp. PD_48]|nr:Phospholipase C [Myotisia sp. PD_48]
MESAPPPSPLLTGRFRSNSKSSASLPQRIPGTRDDQPTAFMNSQSRSAPSLSPLSKGLSNLSLVHQTFSYTSSSPASSPQLNAEPYLMANRYSIPALTGPLASPSPLELPESVMFPRQKPQPMPITEPTSATTSNIKGAGLMRRLSRGAASKLARRRQSTTQESRDNSSGPVIIRRRSDSKTGTSTSWDSALDSSYEEDETYDAFGAWCGLDGNKPANGFRISVANIAGGIAPKVDPILQRGCTLTKVTKLKKKHMTFYLDFDSGKVFWDLSNPSKRLYIDDIKEIRIGADARNYRVEHQVSEEFESRWFTIIFANAEGSKNRPVKTIHLIAPDATIFELWTTTLEHIARYRIGLMIGLTGSVQSESILKAHWQREICRRFPQGVKSGEEENLDLGAIENLCHSLHINCAKSTIREQFTTAATGATGRINFGQFRNFLQTLKYRKDIQGIFDNCVRDSAQGMDLDDFLAFLRDCQGEDIESNKSYWIATFEKFVRKSKIRSQSLPESPTDSTSLLSLDAFSSFLISSANGIFPPHVPPPKLDHPLNDYFISSSHNTYLLGRQVAGSSSTEAYVTALQKGCRCVEIDCWDGADGRPIVSHGRTMTTSVLFADCISVINRYAFLSSDYPLILSLEVHCNPEQQVAMTNIMKDTFQEKLVLEPLRADWPILPSPEALKHRILVKVKTADESIVTTGTASPSVAAGRKRSSSSPFAPPTLLEDPIIASLPPLSSPSTIANGLDNSFQFLGARSLTTTSMSSASDDSDVGPGAISTRKEKKKQQKSRIVKHLADLGVYTRGYKWHSFASPESKRFNHVYSFAERSFEGLCRDSESKALLEAHNRQFLTRVYPSGFRLRSSNFDPNICWRRSVQMVALNWQTYDVGMQMNQAMFAAGNDRTGYVLKPESLRVPPTSRISRVPGDGKPKVDRKLVRFSVQVISAQQLPRSKGMGPEDNINPYIEIEMFSADDKKKGLAVGEGGMDTSGRNGVTGIGYPHRRRTRIELGNGYNPIFNDTFKFSLETKYPDLVFVRWVVWSSLDGKSVGGNNSVQLATFTAKLSSLSQGYRYLPLYDGSGDQYLFSTLFCRITKLEPEPALTLINDSKAERRGIFRQFGQSVFKRGLSTEREKDKDRESAKQGEQSKKPNDSDWARKLKNSSPVLKPSYLPLN